MERGTEGHKLYLFDLAHDNINDEDMIRGFIKYYVLNGLTLGNLQDDCVFHTCYPVEGVQAGLQRLRSTLEQMAEDRRTEEHSLLKKLSQKQDEVKKVCSTEKAAAKETTRSMRQ